MGDTPRYLFAVLLAALAVAPPWAIAQFSGSGEVTESVPQEASSEDFSSLVIGSESVGGEPATSQDFAVSPGTDPADVVGNTRSDIFKNGFE